MAGRNRWFRGVVFIASCLLPRAALAHPGSGIVIDRLGQVYFVDMVSGVWKIDVHGVLTHIPGPAFHWLALDAENRFRDVQLPSGSGGDIVRLGAGPTLLLSSDVPVAIGRDGSLYYPSHGGGTPLQILKLSASGQAASVARLSATTARGPLRDVNGLASGADGSLYYTEDVAIQRIDRQGRVSSIARNVSLAGCASTPSGGAEDPLLRGLAVDASGMIYVAATACGSVLKVTPGGTVRVLYQGEGPWAPTGVALFGNDVYVLEFLHAESDDRRAMLPRVRKIMADGRSSIIATVTRH
jgi:sugar lactone lactonase YvrE